MSWILIAFGGPIFYAISTHIDKHLVERYFKHVDPTILLTPSITIFVPLGIWLLQPGVLTLSVIDAVLMILAGMLYMLGMVFYLRALQQEDASVVSPLFQTIPIFGFLLAYFLLHELPTAIQTIGGLIIVFGSVFLSLDFSGQRHKIKSKLVIQMLCAAFILACSYTLFKFLVSGHPFWTTIFWSNLGEISFGLLLLLYPPYFKQFLTLFTRERAGIWIVGSINEGINLLGMWCSRLALTMAPLSLVQAVNSTTPAFVFILGVLLALLIPRLGRESLVRAHLIQRLSAIILIIIGTIIIGGN